MSSVSDDSNNERFQQKKAKTEASMSVSASSAHDRRKTVGWKVDANGDKFWELSKMRRVTISSFRGKTLVNIREYYEKDGQELPGKKVLRLPARHCPTSTDLHYRAFLCQSTSSLFL